MIRAYVTNTLDDLAGDARKSAVASGRELAKVVRRNAEQGNRIAKRNAKATARRHGKRYPAAMSAEKVTPYSWVWGPEKDKPQGGMSFEGGSKNQPAHHDLDKSRIEQAPLFAEDVVRTAGGLFW